MENKILEVHNLSKIYHQKNGEVLSLKDISFDIYNHEFVSIVGPSGCGKSTLLGIISNIIDKSSGNIKFYKKDFRIGYMLQEDALLDWLTILDNCLLGLKITNNLNKKTKSYVIDLINKYGLKDFMNSYPKNLSGGMKQKVALIRTLAICPDILLLDEPFSSLDYQTRLNLADEIYKIIKNEGKTAIMVTHDIEEAISLSDRVIVLTKRPTYIKKIHNIVFNKKDVPTKNRKDEKFKEIYEYIWKELKDYE